MFKISSVKIFFSFIKNFPTKNFYRSKSKEDYEILHHLSDKKMHIKTTLVPEARYGGETLISLITGTEAGRHAGQNIEELFYKLHVPIMFEEINVDDDDHDRREIISSVLRNKYALNFDIHHTEVKKNVQYMTNDELDLFVGVVKLFPFCGYKMFFKDVDIVMLVQNCSGDNTKLEYEPVEGLVETLKVTEETKIMKLVNYAFAYAVKNQRRKISFVHKTLNLPRSDSILLDSATYVKKFYPQIRIEFIAVDTVARELVLHPYRFDVICSSDLYGCIITSIAAAVCGGPNLFAYSNVGDNFAIFQPLQNKLSIPLPYKDLSPYGLITCVVQLLLHINFCEFAEIIWKSLIKTMLVDNYVTKAYGGNCDSKDVIKQVIYNVGKPTC